MYWTTRFTAVKGAEDHRAKIWIVHKGTDGQIPLLVWDCRTKVARKLKFDAQDGEMAEKRATTAVLGLARGWDIEVCR